MQFGLKCGVGFIPGLGIPVQGLRRQRKHTLYGAQVPRTRTCINPMSELVLVGFKVEGAGECFRCWPCVCGDLRATR